MVNKIVNYSLDEETLDYLKSMPARERSKTVREALKLHKHQHRNENNSIIPKIQVKIHAKN